MEYVIIVTAALAAIALTAFVATKIANGKSGARISALKKENEILERQLCDNVKQAEARKSELKADFQRQLNEKDAAYRQMMAEQDESYRKQMELFRDQLKNDTQEILQKRQDELTKTGSTAMDAIVRPLNERLKEMREALDKTNSTSLRKSTDIQASIRQMFEHTNALGDKTEKLSEALRSKGKVQGDWGENILEKILQASGMQPGIHYDTQKNFQDEEGRKAKKTLNADVIDEPDIPPALTEQAE